MTHPITLEALLDGCANDSFDDGIRIDTALLPLGGPGGPVKPAVYEGGTYQMDQRWADPDDDEPTPVIVIDNVPSQANRLEDALRRNRESLSIPEFVLDLSSLTHLPAHLPKQLSSLQFPHRNGDAYLRDATVGGERLHQERVGAVDFRGHRADMRSPDRMVPAGASIRILAVPPGQEAAEHQACPGLGFRDRWVAPRLY